VIRYDGKRYRIEECDVGSGLDFALDFKEPNNMGSFCLVNIGWYRYYHQALSKMAELVLKDYEEMND